MLPALWPDTVETWDDLTVQIASRGLSCDVERSMLKGEGAEPTKRGSLKGVDALLDLLIIIVSRPDLHNQREIIREDHTRVNNRGVCCFLNSVDKHSTYKAEVR